MGQLVEHLVQRELGGSIHPWGGMGQKKSYNGGMGAQVGPAARPAPLARPVPLCFFCFGDGTFDTDLVNEVHHQLKKKLRKLVCSLNLEFYLARPHVFVSGVRPRARLSFSIITVVVKAKIENVAR